MSQPPAKLQKWVARQKSDLTGDGPIVKLTLHHAVEGGEGLEFIDKFEKIADISALDLAQMIWDSACQDADSYPNGMPQRYKLLAFRVETEDSDGMPETTFVFLIQSPKPLDGTGGTTEPPNDKGMMAQFMRHTEQNQRMIAGTLERILERVNIDHERERARRIEAEDRAASMAEAREALLDRKQERELEFAQAKQRAVYVDQLLSGVLTFAPLVLMKLFGGEGAPAPAGSAARVGHDQATVETVMQFLKSLSQEDAMKVLGALPPTKQAMLVEIYKAANKTDQKRQEQKPPGLKEKEAHGDEEKEKVKEGK